jgi:[ribosomal protein S5]-alanine N-acetyltransferase
MHALCNQAGIRKYLFDDQPVSIEFIESIVEQSERDFESRGFGMWLVGDAGGAAPIGFCGLRVADGLGEVEIIYALTESILKRGYAVEAASAVMRHAFEHANLPRLIGITDVPNVASWRVLERLAMREYRPPNAEPHLRYAVIDQKNLPKIS